MSSHLTKLLVVDDSALMRKHMRLIFEQERDFDLAFARNGREALEQAERFGPDVVTLDVNMPEMDGLTCLQRLNATGTSARVVMVSSLTEAGAEVTLKAIEMGAVDFVPKPGGTVSLNIDAIRWQLVNKVRAAALARPKRAQCLRERVRAQQVNARKSASLPVRNISNGLVVIGVSTGGPRTLEEVLPSLPADFSCPIVIAQHMPSSFTGVFARRMDSLCALDVVEVSALVPLEAGHAYIGRGDADIVVRQTLGRLMADSVPSDDTLWHPSADRLTVSASQAVAPERLLGILLTGMGHDGAAAMTALHQRGGRTIAESEESAVVFGMPAELIRMGGADKVLPAAQIAEHMIAWSRGQF